MGRRRALGALWSRIALSRRIEGGSHRHQRELERRQKERYKLAEAERSALEVETYENHVECLTSVHRECSERIDWGSLRHPGVDRSESLRIRHQLESYRVEKNIQNAVSEKSRLRIESISHTPTVSRKQSPLAAGHGLLAVLRRELYLVIDKRCRTSDWGRPLSEAQTSHAALVLIGLRAILAASEVAGS